MGIAYAQSYSVDAEGNKLCTCDKLYEALPGKPFEVDFVADGKGLLKRLMFRLNIIPNASAVLFRKSVYLQAGGGVTGMRICGDWVTWARMMNLGKVAFVAEPLSYFRWHSGSVRAKMGFSKISITESYQAHAEVLRLVEVDAAVREEVATYCAMSWLDRNAGENLTLGEHREIFQIARQIDPKVPVRIFRKLCRWALSHLGLNSFVSTLAQRSAVERVEQSLS